MLLSENVQQKWNGNNRKYYESLGYIWSGLNTYFEVKVSQLSKSSKTFVSVKCDYCGEISEKTYNNYTKARTKLEKDSCINTICTSKKIKESNLKIYGTTGAPTLKDKKETKNYNKQISEIIDITTKRNIQVLNMEDYEDNRTRLKIVCNNHLEYGIQDTNALNLKRNLKCCFYGGNEVIGERLRLDESDVFSYFKSKDLIVCDSEKYTHKDGQIKCYCIKHPDKILSKTLNCLEHTNIACEYCRNEISLDGIALKLRNTISIWKRESEENCNHRCIFTNDSEYEVHHLYSFLSIVKDCLVELKIDPLNYTAEDVINLKQLCKDKHKELLGVCLRPDIHMLYHIKYSRVNNTPEQFEEFKQRYFKGEFNIPLMI